MTDMEEVLNVRFRELDGLRGIAALAVVLSHYGGAYNSRYTEDPEAFTDFAWGGYGVNLFFLISGFVVLISAQRAEKPSDFVVSRFSRLYPPYWIALGLAVLIAWLGRIPHVPLDVPTVLWNLTMVQRWFMQNNVDDVYWTLAVEMQFYFLLFALLLITRCRISDRIIVWVSAMWMSVAVAVAVIVAPHSHGISPQVVATPYKILNNAVLAEYAPLFCAGMLLYLSRRNGKIHPLALVALAVGVLNAGLIDNWPKAIWIAGISLAFLFVTMRKQTRILLFAPIQWLGKVSFSLYLTHTFVGFIVIQALWPIVGRNVAILFAIAAALLVAWALYEVGERRLSKLVRDLLQRSKGPRSASPQQEAA